MMSIKINEVKTMNLNRSHMNGSSSIIENLYEVKLTVVNFCQINDSSLMIIKFNEIQLTRLLTISDE